MRRGQIISIREASELLRVSYYTIYRLIQSGAIHAIKVKGSWRIFYDDLLLYLTRRHTLNLPEGESTERGPERGEQKKKLKLIIRRRTDQ